MLVSVVIATLDEETAIGHTITCARRNYSESELDIIVCDGGSTDATISHLPPSLTVIHSPRGRGTQMNYGAAASHGEIPVFCHADSQLPSGWRKLILDALSVPKVSGGTFQTLILPARGLLLRLRNHMQFAAKWHTMIGEQV
ncbi:MAG: glycosyltransferase [Anaerolineae bacterium]|nr:glycosyltransferase [Anaerolineae bacterium]